MKPYHVDLRMLIEMPMEHLKDYGSQNILQKI